MRDEVMLEGNERKKYEYDEKVHATSFVVRALRTTSCFQIQQLITQGSAGWAALEPVTSYPHAAGWERPSHTTFRQNEFPAHEQCAWHAMHQPLRRAHP